MPPKAMSSISQPGAHAEAHQYVLVGEGRSEVQRDVGEVRPSGNPVHKSPSIRADRSGGNGVGGTVIGATSDIGPGYTPIIAQLDYAAVPARGLKREAMAERDGEPGAAHVNRRRNEHLLVRQVGLLTVVLAIIVRPPPHMARRRESAPLPLQNVG
jgi:hypothetical protein